MYICILDPLLVGITITLGGFNHIEKYESQWEGLSHILWNVKYV